MDGPLEPPAPRGTLEHCPSDEPLIVDPHLDIPADETQLAAMLPPRGEPLLPNTTTGHTTVWWTQWTTAGSCPSRGGGGGRWFLGCTGEVHVATA